MRFVILKHSRQGADTHYDLMIEQFEGSEKLFTFSFACSPHDIMIAGFAEGKRIFDHESRFLDYEGSVNKGQGNVVRVDQGQVETQGIASHDLDIWPIRYNFTGTHLKGEFEILNTDDECRLQKIPSD